MKTALTLSAALLAVSLMPATAAAQAPTAGQLATFKANDKNKDGKLDKTEFGVVARSYGFGPQADQVLAQADANKDKFIGEAEFGAALAAGSKTTAQVATPAAPSAGGNAAGGTTVMMSNLPPGALANAPPALQLLASFKDHDKSKDAKLDKTEYQAAAKALNIAAQADALWTSANADKDAFLTEVELAQSLGAGSGARMVMSGSPGGGAPANEEQRMAAFKAQDKNKDGKLTKAEYAEVLKAIGSPIAVDTAWPQRDANKDGFITEAEFKTPLNATLTVGGPPPTPPQ